MSEEREIVVGETADGEAVSLPVVQLLTGRGFVTGKSGSGKSNTASVVAEELLEAGYPLLVVDTDGEYYGLKEEYEMLHAGADEECDIQIGPEHAEQMATIALEENVPVILDVSGYLDEEVADELLCETARQLFVKEKKLKKPFLLVVEEVHEYIPEGGGVGETGKMLIKIGKRGRKHGLGIVGISQRPADVKKDFITQANWLVWHRLTWDNDTKVAGRIIDSEYAELVADLDDGEAFVQTDWTDVDVRTVQFRRKRTFDAGATPGLDDFERPDLKSVSDNLVGELEAISERERREQDRVEELQEELRDREAEIERLEADLASARDVSDAARQMAEALSQPESVQTQLPGSSDDLRRLHDEIVDLETQRNDLEDELATLEAELAEREAELADRDATLDEREERVEALVSAVEERDDRIDALESDRDRLRERIAELEAALERVLGGGETPVDEAALVGLERLGEGTDDADRASILIGDDDLEYGFTEADQPPIEATEILIAGDERDVEDLLDEPGVADRLSRACANSRCEEATARRVVALLATDGPLETGTVAARVERSPVAVQSLLSELRTRDVVDRTADDTYRVDEASLTRAVEAPGD